MNCLISQIWYMILEIWIHDIRKSRVLSGIKNGISDFLRAEIPFFDIRKWFYNIRKNNLHFQKISLSIIATNFNECSPAFCAKTFTVVMWALGAPEYIYIYTCISNLGIYYSNLIDMSVLKPNEILHEIENDYNTFTPTPCLFYEMNK